MLQKQKESLGGRPNTFLRICAGVPGISSEMRNGFFTRFMSGRCGIDELNIFIAVVLIILSGASYFTQNAILYAVEFLILLLLLFRMLSKNIERRATENRASIKLLSPLTKSIRRWMHRIKDRENRYYRCPRCYARLRVPRYRGEITITCPVCNHNFDKMT